MIRHILLITFKGEASPDDIAAVRAAFLAIPHQVSGVLAVEWGQNDSPEGRAEGFTHSVLMTFADEAARQSYLPHPDHDALKALFRPVLDRIIVLDYTLQAGDAVTV
ncbi:Dabb family protein [Aeromonas bestiarum]|uniref:Dabb family protein n=1 Tax=Aeromonas bestiarum TaxID=105751 RepID=UPI00259FB07E|nr:Dabb family protein [Aeromonas bestiarum]MDM5090820.1 Dabb family protein [Aeromonas bestiarum]